MSRMPPEVSEPPARGRSTAPTAGKRRLVDKLHEVKLTTWFLLIGGGLGVLLVFAVPPAQGIDEPNHFSRVWTLTNGAIVAPSRGPHEIVWIYPSAGVS